MNEKDLINKSFHFPSIYTQYAVSHRNLTLYVKKKKLRMDSWEYFKERLLAFEFNASHFHG